MKLQLRLPKGKTMEDQISELALTMLESIKRELDSMEVPFDSFHALENRIASALSPYLLAYDKCGTDPACTDRAYGPCSFDDQIYLLSLPQYVDGLVDEILSKGLESIYLLLDKHTADALKRRVRSSLQRTLMYHIHWNPVCGNHEVCRTSVPVSPWKKAAV